MKRGVWIVEVHHANGKVSSLEVHDHAASCRTRCGILNELARFGEEYRAVRYVPAESLTTARGKKKRGAKHK